MSRFSAHLQTESSKLKTSATSISLPDGGMISATPAAVTPAVPYAAGATAVVGSAVVAYAVEEAGDN